MSVISQMKEVVMASILSGKPPAQAEKNLFYLIDKSTGISNEKHNTIYVSIQKVKYFRYKLRKIYTGSV